MTFFTDDEPNRYPSGRRVRTGWILLLVAVIGTAAFAWVPSPYVIEQPGATFDTLGEVSIDDEPTPLIEVPGQTVYPTEGSLTLLTVGVVGSRRTPVSWLDVIGAWFDPSKAVVPIEAVYPEGQTVEMSNQENQALMEQSQHDATAAALTGLGYDVPRSVFVRSIAEGLPADGALQVDDQILTANGTEVTDVASLQELVRSAGADEPISFAILRDGEQLEIDVTAVDDSRAGPIIGVGVETIFDFPFEVQIQLEDVGGPSAGMMFALGIMDKLTPGAMTGGEHIAGTGTLTAAGEVGPIGGIRQKLYGAVRSGAEWFLAPSRNCNEVIGHVPGGLTVFSVSTLDEAVEAVEGIEGGDTEGLATCEAGGSA